MTWDTDTVQSKKISLTLSFNAGLSTYKLRKIYATRVDATDKNKVN